MRLRSNQDSAVVTAALAKTVIVPFGGKGNEQHLLTCVDSLRTDSPSFDEIIVVLDGLGAAQRDRLKPKLMGEDVRLLCLSEQVGPAAARNAAVAVSAVKDGLLIFVDADVQVTRGFGAKIDLIFQEHPHIDACFGSYDDEPASPGFFAQYRNLLHHYVHQESGPHAETFWAGCGAIRRQVFLDAGGFCSSFSRPSIEDVELGMRLRAEGKQIRMESTLLVKHLKGWTLRGMLTTDLCDRAIPWVRMLWQFRKVPNSLNTSQTHRAKLLLATVVPLIVVASGPSWGSAYLAMVALVAFLFLSRGFLGFLRKRRGVWFMLIAVFWQWVFYVECALAIVWVAFEIGFGKAGARLKTGNVDLGSQRDENDSFKT